MTTSNEGGEVDEQLAALLARAPRLAAVHARVGDPPAFRRPLSLRSLVLVVLEQQLSLDAAAAHLAALEQALGGAPDATALRRLDQDVARCAGVSRQKHRTLVAVGEAVGSGSLDLQRLATAADDEVRASVTAVHGLGPWTADIVLLGMLGRPDVWPVGDRALRVAARDELGLDDVPDGPALTAIGAPWRPRRSAAARLLWHAYLVRRGRRAPTV